MLADKAVFDSSCVDLMDFQASEHGLHFMPVLPYSPTCALINTWICDHADHAARTGYTQELNDYLIKRWPNAKFDLAYTEAASLPLAAQKAHKQWLRQTQLVPMASLTGTVLATTSYAFLAALQDAKRLANLIKSKDPLTSFKRNKIDAGMNALFLFFCKKRGAWFAGFCAHIFQLRTSNPDSIFNWASQLARPFGGDAVYFIAS